MSAEKIIEQIKKDSEKEVKQIISEAESRYEVILKSAKNEAEMEANEILAVGKNQSETLKKILISKANQDVKRDIMNAREEVIDECFTKARHKLSNLKGEDYEKIVRRLIEDGQKKLGGNCTVMFTRDTDKKIAELLGIKIDGNIESSGGVILRSVDKKVTLDYTFDGIIKRDKNKIRIKVGKLLFS